METIKVRNREIARMAFDYLRGQRKKDAALRLAGCMLHYSSISLGIVGYRDGDTKMRRGAENRLEIYRPFPFRL